MTPSASWHSIAQVREALRNHHDSGCFIYLPSGTCDCGVAPNTDALAALDLLRELADAAEQVRWEAKRWSNPSPHSIDQLAEKLARVRGGAKKKHVELA